MSEMNQESSGQQESGPTSLASDRNIRYGVPRGYVLNDTFQNFWPNVVLGIACWMAFLPALYLGAIVPASMLLKGVTPDMSSEQILALLFGMTIAGLGVGFLTLTLGSIIGIASNAILSTVQIYGRAVENLPVACLFGGLVGLVLSLAAGPWLESENTAQSIAGLIAATVLGQAGGIRGALKAERYWQLIGKNPEMIDRRVQFSLQQLLIATVWVTMLLTMMQLAGMFTASWGVFFATWLILQAAAAGLVMVLSNDTQSRGCST